MKQQSDTELIHQAQTGDQAAFVALVERHMPLLRHIARRMVGQPDITDDLVQETVLQAYLALPHLRDPSKARAWLCGIITNVCRGVLRQHAAQPLSLEAVLGSRTGDHAVPQSTDPDPQHVAEMHEQQAVLWEAVQALPPTRRAVTVLFYYRQQSVREVAVQLGISTAAVKVHLHAARKTLRHQLVPTVQQVAVMNTQKGETMMVSVTIADVVEQMYGEWMHGVILLVDGAKQRALPIWTGQHEAEVLVRALRGIALPRPYTLDMMGTLLRELDTTLDEVEINALHDMTYYATLRIRQGSIVRTVDARPSDALALAALHRRPVTVDATLLAQWALVLTPAQVAQLGRGQERIVARLEAEMQAIQTYIARITPDEVEHIRQDLAGLLAGKPGA